MGSGIIYVESHVVRTTALTEDEFGAWYDDIHIPEVLVLPGFPSAARYRCIPPPNQSTATPEYLVTYAMPSIDYLSNPSFLSIMATGPTPEDREKYYDNVHFGIRFCAETDVREASPISGSTSSESGARWVASVKFADDSAEKGWYESYVARVEKMPGFVRMRKFEALNGVQWNDGTPGAVEVAKGLLLLEFADGEERDVRVGLEEGAEVKWWEVTKEFPESEWGHVGVVAEP